MFVPEAMEEWAQEIEQSLYSSGSNTRNGRSYRPLVGRMMEKYESKVFSGPFLDESRRVGAKRAANGFIVAAGAVGFALETGGIGALLGGSAFIYGADEMKAGMLQMLNGGAQESDIDLLVRSEFGDRGVKVLHNTELVVGLGAGGYGLVKAGVRYGPALGKSMTKWMGEGSKGVPKKIIWQTPEQALPSMSKVQAQNLNRFLDKLPSNSTNIRVKDFLSGGKVFQADSPASKILGSYARYEKQVDEFGNTVFYTKTTIGAKGEIIHIAPKFPPGGKIYPEFDVNSQPKLTLGGW